MSDPIAIPVQGTTMTFNAVAVGGLMSISGIGSGTSSDIDTTTFASTAKEFLPGLRDFGSLTVELRRNQDDLGQVEMFNAAAAQTAHTVVITLPLSTANVATFTAYVKSLTTDLKADGAVTGQAVLKISGVIVWS